MRISWGLTPCGGKWDPGAEFTRCRLQGLGGLLAQPGNQNRELSAAMQARLDLGERCQ